MSKNDLEVRPIFHRMEDAIRSHVLICFMALALGKYMEIRTGLPLRHILDLLMQVTDAVITDEQGKKTVLRSELSKEVQELLERLGVSH